MLTQPQVQRYSTDSGLRDIMIAQRGEGLGDGFVQGFCRHVERMRGVVQIVDNDGAGFESHDGNLSYSPFVRPLGLAVDFPGAHGQTSTLRTDEARRALRYCVTKPPVSGGLVTCLD